MQEDKKWGVKRYDMEGSEHCKIEKENLQLEGQHFALPSQLQHSYLFFVKLKRTCRYKQ